MHEAPLTSLLSSCLEPTTASELKTIPELETRLSRFVAIGQSAWPEVHLAAEDVIRHVGLLWSRSAAGADFLDLLRPADVFIVSGCVRGRAVAGAAFAQRLSPVVAAAIGRVRNDPWFISEATQLLHEKLLVSQPGTTPRVADFSGRSPIEAWIRVAAVRVAIDLVRREQPGTPQSDDELGDVADVGLDPELAYLKTRYGDEFRTCFEQAFHVTR